MILISFLLYHTFFIYASPSGYGKIISYMVYIRRGKGRLAQLVERYIDVVDVRGSNPLPPTQIYGTSVKKRKK